MILSTFYPSDHERHQKLGIISFNKACYEKLVFWINFDTASLGIISVPVMHDLLQDKFHILLARLTLLKCNDNVTLVNK
jgi:hypothetical protein